MGIGRRKYRTGRHVAYQWYSHIVVVTKYRRSVITDRVLRLLVAQARRSYEMMKATLLAADGEDDHLHLLVAYPPKVALSRLVGAIKTNTSRVVCQQQ